LLENNGIVGRKGKKNTGDISDDGRNDFIRGQSIEQHPGRDSYHSSGYSKKQVG